MPDLDAMIKAKLAAAADLLKLPGVTGVASDTAKKMATKPKSLPSASTSSVSFR